MPKDRDSKDRDSEDRDSEDRDSEDQDSEEAGQAMLEYVVMALSVCLALAGMAHVVHQLARYDAEVRRCLAALPL